MTGVLNNKLTTPEKPFSTFGPASTDVDIGIQSVTLFVIQNKETLDNAFPEVFNLTSGITPITTRFFNEDVTSQNFKPKSTVVVTVSSTDAVSIGDTIRFYSRPHWCVTIWSASPPTQCKKHWKFGHATQGCCESFETCPICTKQHDCRRHRCVKGTCPGFLTLMTSCCSVSPVKCVNCNGNNAANSKTCLTYLAMINKSKANLNLNTSTLAPPTPHPQL
ncbi:uncharacterized protein LAJ45_11536 [Morchella importuna]|uniref:uncharacterized protein n=1 Tax=Morchella importuna TaxID=1174673 RepID=UPI001E8EA506|nr:uncharacterized protein LAJ45_11536 [Morchella importuna]KAH8144471.1 hypothetical protein LAJ45_11536 [Morchella importuna]